MITPSKFLASLSVVLSAAILSSCFVDDPGPIQEMERDYAVVDFDRLEMGDAFHIQVEQGNFFQVSVSGDRRNVEDLRVEKEGSTLVIRYNQNRTRRHDTYVSITMPELFAVNFSGASQSRIHGFTDVDKLRIHLSGASVCQLDVETTTLESVLSGASCLSLRGGAESLNADLSGASALNAFAFPVTHADLVFSGASDGKVAVSDELRVVASGASHLLYRGQPSVISDVSGASSVHPD